MIFINWKFHSITLSFSLISMILFRFVNPAVFMYLNVLNFCFLLTASKNKCTLCGSQITTVLNMNFSFVKWLQQTKTSNCFKCSEYFGVRSLVVWISDWISAHSRTYFEMPTNTQQISRDCSEWIQMRSLLYEISDSFFKLFILKMKNIETVKNMFFIWNFWCEKNTWSN